ncbi:EpuA protein [Geobacillus stearothermophilus]|uniref:DNA-directed RNA polymerase subunit beta n=1 Tax=Geobacillus sp. DSP4a TaxID=2508873 RepID=UPI00050284C6|nr:DNA-directed RNA polymerase subunit beta [Geobacillus sp. DSP4a]KFL14863.1 EpuA protein [Geobacillus stearothermophilus]KFX36316.1 EpuA protein [Geobacillus stearothermophilus]NNU98257.1 DNA-directed RNA polymerase subunit beta [Geobacillus sp. DSP4a]WJQ07025.1 DNA-directed RNA polymerase subunit beta [Geobacillus stearothermophilus]WJQ13941.1 DNA-directed RNA polymerase subunit beta [Geobacillus stearothermophilus]
MSNETKNEPLSRVARRKQQRSAASPPDIGAAAALPEEQPADKANEPPSEVEPAESGGAKPRRFARTRLIRIGLRLIIVAALMALSLAAGAVVGYSAIGDGAWLDVFRPSTWQHILDFVEKGT